MVIISEETHQASEEVYPRRGSLQESESLSRSETKLEIARDGSTEKYKANTQYKSLTMLVDCEGSKHTVIIIAHNVQ